MTFSDIVIKKVTEEEDTIWGIKGNDQVERERYAAHGRDDRSLWCEL